MAHETEIHAIRDHQGHATRAIITCSCGWRSKLHKISEENPMERMTEIAASHRKVDDEGNEHPAVPLTIATTHIQSLLSRSLNCAKAVHGANVFRTDIGSSIDDRSKEKVLTALRMARHAVSELEAELHKIEYGYDIS